MRHVVKAKISMSPEQQGFIDIENAVEVKGVSPIVKFTIQSDPVNQVGVNGCQVNDIIEYAQHLLESLHNTFPCHENEKTITCLQMAVYWQKKRIEDRLKRNVEGFNKP